MPELEKVYYQRMDSPVGQLLLAATDKGLRRLHFQRGDPLRPGRNELWIESEIALRPYREQLLAYFRGELREFTFNLDLVGTAFQKKCWEALLRIPYGTTCSYRDLALAVGSPRGFRAVGQANHNNPVAIVVPCHRVVGANGSLTGYGGGMETKEKLLRLEGVNLQQVLGFGGDFAASPSRH
jgi:methylated-DNA-[protein]-cysteine S-methyltransferase